MLLVAATISELEGESIVLGTALPAFISLEIAGGATSKTEAAFQKRPSYLRQKGGMTLALICLVK